ncbi:MAG: MFS transporter [Bacteroidota bacterium]|nr:MFS transporter [Bacteroidota bacterium]
MGNIRKGGEPSAFYRWMVLLVISLAMMGSYYIYDSISPLADLLKKDLHFSDSNLGTLNAIYSIPNIFMVLIGGIIIDRIGTKRSSVIFGLLVMVGSFITALNGSLFGMATGRLIFGLGAESMNVAITTSIARWFKGKELSFAFGLNLTVARLGSFLALNSPFWAEGLYAHWQGPLLITMVAGVITLLTLVIYYFLDWYAERNFTLAKEGSQDKILISDILKFGKSFWFITFLCVTFYAAMFPFQTFAIKFFQEAHGVSRQFAGFLSSLLTLAAMVFTPLFGLLSDRIGKRSLLMMFGSALIIPVYLLMAYTHISLYIPMGIMGIAFSLVPAVMWPSVAIVVDSSKLGTAYGLMTMIQNIGLAGFNLLIGWANDYSQASAVHPAGYHLGMWIFSACGFLGLFFAFMLRASERSNSHGLEVGTLHANK